MTLPRLASLVAISSAGRWLGAISADVTRSDARLPHSSAPRRIGYSYRVNYAKSFDDLGSTLAFMGYRFSGRHFLSMPEFILRSALPGEQFRDEKQSYTVSYSQYVQPLALSVSLSASWLNYWNGATANNHYMLSLNKNASFGPLRNVTACRCRWRAPRASMARRRTRSTPPSAFRWATTAS